MNKTVKTVAILLSAGFLLVGCASKEKSKSTDQSSTKVTSKATSKSSTKAKTKESSTDKSKKRMHSKVAGDNPLETMKEAVTRNQEKFKDLMGHGFALTSEYKDGIFYIRNTIDYTKVDMQKLKEIIPTLNLEADNTISYSKAKELFINSGMVEK